jgi:hypothetical protein
MNPETNQFEILRNLSDDERKEQAKALETLKEVFGEFHPNLLRPNGEPVPKTWTIFKVGEEVMIKGYTFKVAYIGEKVILFEPVGPVVIKTEEK